NNANRVEVTDAAKLEGMSALTIEAWVLPRNAASHEGMCIVSKRVGTGNNDSYNLFVWTGQRVEARVNYAGIIQSTTALEDDTWYHVACVFNGQGKAGEKMKIYINGVMETSGDHPDNAVDAGDASAWIGELDAIRGFAWDGIIDEVGIWNIALGEAEINQLMVQTKTEMLKFAFGPSPADGALHADTWVNLSWSAGEKAVSHDVYLGDNFDDVNDATVDSPVFRGNQTGTFVVAGFPGFAYPDGLVPGTTYYWRIDEVNPSEPDSPWKGKVWSFSIPPKTAYNPNPADGDEFVDIDATLSWTGGFGAKLHTVYIGADFDDVSNAAGGAPQGTATYKPASLELEKVYYWRVDEFDALATYKGDIWGFTTPGAAGSLLPVNGATDVQINTMLNWTAATTAVSHDVYFGSDKDAVKNATTASPEYKGNRALGVESYDPGKLAWHSDYYWRVDAVYNAGPVKGLVWSFTTADFTLVDDFESYNDIDPPDPASNRRFDKWIDGFGTTTNGAIVGNDLPPYAEQAIVHSGSQSLIYRYDNNLKTSEATLTLVSPRDWTEEGVGKLSLWFRGAPANSAERIYVALNGTAVVYHDDPAATQQAGWNEWVIDLQAVADQGVNLANVNTITLGIGTKNSPVAGGTGTMYFDDIRLYR
ncbi:MAG: LamG domain-containing protein, partial [Planctomycetota bacterium]